MTRAQELARQLLDRLASGGST
jgi:acyl-CoA synthetase (AMP-forming)/AMP-acid ligase II